MLKLNHGADVHYRPSRAAEVFASLDVFERESEGVDLNILAGDLWDYPVQNTGASGFPEYIGRLVRIANKAPIVMVQGTPTHDADGSLDIFEKASERITVLRPGVAYGLVSENGFKHVEMIKVKTHEMVGYDALIFGVPEPQKKWLLAAGGEVTLDQALRTLFLGYAAIRQKYADLPCILVYHGQFRGARNPNGETVEGGVFIDDLALVGADYIAMGDIHKPQRVGESRGLYAYYPGAAYPTGDWKDSDYEFGFNRVEISDSVSVSRITFPHPMLVKISTNGTACISADRVQTGARVWWEITANKSQSLTINTELALNDLLRFGAAPGSRVTIKLTSDETVRAGEIQALRSLRDKFSLWSRNSGREPTEEQLSKCDAIEADAAGRGVKLNGGSFSFDSLRLRGAKGIWKKQRKDEVLLDLSAVDPGIVGLIGPNGRGKTTIINNFHPWSTMPNMGGPLHKQFRLRDSLREVIMTEHTTGTRYRSRILMDPTLKTPKAEYFLDRQHPGGDWEPVPGITGRLADYDAVVDSIFGTLEMYIRTALMMQFPTADYPDLSKATKGTKKQIMSALAGLDFYEVYKSAAKSTADALTSDVDALKAKLSAMVEALGDHDDLESAMLMAESDVRRISDALPAKEAEGKKLAAEYELLQKRASDQKAIQDQIVEIMNRIPRDQITETSIKRQISELTISLEALPHAKKSIEQFDELKAQEAVLVAEKTRNLEEKARIDEAYRAETNAYDAKRRSAQAELDAARSRKATAEREAAVSRSKLAAPIQDHCPTCAQLLPAEKRRHLQEERAKLEAEIARLGDVVIAATSDEMNADLALVRISAPAYPEIAAFNEAPLRSIRDSLNAIDIAAARQTVERATTAAARIEELTKNIADIEARIRENQAAADSLKARIDPELIFDLEVQKEHLEVARREYQQLSADMARAKSEAEHAAKSFAEYEANVEKIDTTKAQIELMGSELADWNILVQACGANGIQALELDAVCPTIAGVATKLLEQYEDGRYSVRFDTTREGGKGNQIEDFLIQVIDSKDGEEQEFETLSGGEAVWVRKALQDAFGIIRGQNSGVRYLTGFLDESDSALFPEARIAYFRMLESAHEQSVRVHTIIVTHSSELQEMIQSKIDVTRLDVAEGRIAA